MSDFLKNVGKKAGMAPGSLIFTGDRQMEKAVITVFDYGPDEFCERVVETVEECIAFKGTPRPTWINVDGLHDVAIIEEIGKAFSIHPLILEDILHTNQRPKIDEVDNTIYIVMKMLYWIPEEKRFRAEQISFVLTDDFVISFQEKTMDVFDPVRKRIRDPKSRIRKMGSDYLLYSLIDSLVDNYLMVMEKFGEKIDKLENRVMSNPSKMTLKNIHRSKREVLFLRKCIWPVREIVSGLSREESNLVSQGVVAFFRDVYDHINHGIDILETYRDIIAELQNIYLSNLSLKLNEIMKVLTIMASIFIPLTFIVGVYGMNFKFMPELEIWWAYPAVWALMAATVGGLLYYFKSKDWL